MTASTMPALHLFGSRAVIGVRRAAKSSRYRRVVMAPGGSGGI